MPAIDFPNSPVNGDTYTVGSRTWEYQNGVWSFVDPSGFLAEVASTPPLQAESGTIWFDTVSGATFVYYDSEWIQIGQPLFDSVLQRVEAKGDLLVASAGDAVTRVAVGTNGHVLTADSSTATGVKWAAALSSGEDDQIVLPTRMFT